MVSLTASVNSVTPASGNTYLVENVGFGHWFDNANADLDDGNPILSWGQASPETNNQIWTYLTYPSTNGDTVFTLQSLFTTQNEPSFSGRGGYVRVDSSTNQLVQGGQPFAWKLIEAAPQIYKFQPYDDDFSKGGELVVTDINSEITSVQANQAALQFDETLLQQLWSFSNP